MNHKYEWLKKKAKVVGIYKITDRDSGRSYIGKSTDIFNRFQTHMVGLINNNHHNTELQLIFNQVGLTSFTFEVIEILDEFSSEELLSTREIYWWSRELNPINTIKPTIQKKKAEPKPKKVLKQKKKPIV